MDPHSPVCEQRRYHGCQSPVLLTKNSRTVRVCRETTAAAGYSVDLESTNRHELCGRHWSGERSSRTVEPRL